MINRENIFNILYSFPTRMSKISLLIKEQKTFYSIVNRNLGFKIFLSQVTENLMLNHFVLLLVTHNITITI